LIFANVLLAKRRRSGPGPFPGGLFPHFFPFGFGRYGLFIQSLYMRRFLCVTSHNRSFLIEDLNSLFLLIHLSTLALAVTPPFEEFSLLSQIPDFCYSGSNTFSFFLCTAFFRLPHILGPYFFLRGRSLRFPSFPHDALCPTPLPRRSNTSISLYVPFPILNTRSPRHLINAVPSAPSGFFPRRLSLVPRFFRREQNCQPNSR